MTKPITSQRDDRAALRKLAAKAPEGPWFCGVDHAEDAPVHGSSLAMVDTGRESDWPVARLTEWHTAEYLAAVDPQTVIGLIDDLKMATMKIELLSKELAQSDAVIAQVVAMEAPVTFASGERELGLMIECITDGCVNPHVSYYEHDVAQAKWNRRVAIVDRRTS